MSEAITVSVRDVNTITAEIRMIRSNVRTVALSGAIEIGRRLCEAKELLPYGEWGEWLKTEFDYSQPTASRLMTIFREYGAEQQSLFGTEAKYSTLNNLSVSNALRLIAIPDEEREAFAEEHDVENISARELDKLIKEKQEAERLAAETEEKLREAREEKEITAQMYAKVCEDKTKLDAKISEATRDADDKAAAAAAEAKAQAEKEAQSKVNKALKDAKTANAERDRLSAELEKAQKETERIRADLAQLKDNPEVPEDVMQKLRAQFENRIKQAENAAADAERRLKLADPKLTEFKVHFDSVQKEFSTMISALKEADNDTADKLRRAVSAVLNKFLEEVTG